MNIILIKTDQPEAEIYLYDNYVCLGSLSWQSTMTLTETLNARIATLLADKNLSYADLKAIIVFAGPGSFTSLRIGHTVANALAYGLNIPIVSSKGKNWIKSGLELILKKNHNDHMVVPFYGQEANITQPKK